MEESESQLLRRMVVVSIDLEVRKNQLALVLGLLQEGTEDDGFVVSFLGAEALEVARRLDFRVIGVSPLIEVEIDERTKDAKIIANIILDKGVNS